MIEAAKQVFRRRKCPIKGDISLFPSSTHGTPTDPGGEEPVAEREWEHRASGLLPDAYGQPAAGRELSQLPAPHSIKSQLFAASCFFFKISFLSLILFPVTQTHTHTQIEKKN